jgi:hypothetical protein
VVNVALGRAIREQARPGSDDLVEIDFPILGHAGCPQSLKCRVAAWAAPPATAVTGGDVAALELTGGPLPRDAGSARLMDPTAARGAEVAIFGYPQYPELRPNGGWSIMRLSGGVGDGAIQLDAVAGSAFAAQPGYSGSPVVAQDEAGDAVVGILAAASADGQDVDSYAIPVSALIDVWPQAGQAVVSPTARYRGDHYGSPRLARYPGEDTQITELPAAPLEFTGRSAEIDQACHWLRTSERRMAEARIVNIYGIPGSGKTALALRVAHAISDQYPDCQLYFSLRLPDQMPASMEELVGNKLRQLGIPPSEMPTGLDARAEAFRSRIARRRSLLVFDNATSKEQIWPLLRTQSAGMAVIVTSWTLLPGLGEGLRLAPLSDDDAIEMLGAVSRRPIASADRDTVRDVARLLGNLPLALVIAAGHMLTHEAWTWTRLGSRLRTEAATPGVKPLVIGRSEVQASFQLAYDELKPDIAQGYRLLGLAPNGRMSRNMAQVLLSDDPNEAEDVFDELVAQQLLQQEGGPAYRMHDLLWLRARTLVAADPERQAATERLTTWSLGQLQDRYPGRLRDSLRALPSLGNRGHLLSLPLTDTYVDTALAFPGPGAGLLMPAGPLAAMFPHKFPRLVLMAPGGSGKTTMIGHLADTTAADLLNASRIPLVILLRDIRPGTEATNLESLIVTTLRDRYDCELTQGALVLALERGDAFVIADGLDEVIDPALREHVLKAVNDFAARYSQVPMLITTRPFAVADDALPGFMVAGLMPWNSAQAWAYLEKQAMARSMPVPADLMGWLDGQPNSNVIGTPLGLQMLLNRYQAEQEIPGSFTILLEDLLAERMIRETIRGTGGPDGPGRPDRRGALDERTAAEVLAYMMQSSSVNRTTVTEGAVPALLASVANGASDEINRMSRRLTNQRSGLLVPIGRSSSGEQMYAFPHTAYREHLAASHLARMSAAAIVDVMQARREDPSWEAVFVTALELRRIRGYGSFPNAVDPMTRTAEPQLYATIQIWAQQAEH